MNRTEKFIESFPIQLASEFKQLLKAFRKGRVEETQAKEKLTEMIETAFNTVRSRDQKKPQNIGGRKYWRKALES